MRRKIVAILLVLVLVCASLIGCNKDSKETKSTTAKSGEDATKKDKDKNIKMGRYVEEKVQLPELSTNENVFKMIQNKNKQIEVYTREEKNSSIHFYSYVQKEPGKWEKSTPTWLNDGKVNNNSVSIESILLGKDGNYYALYLSYAGNTQKAIVIKATDETKESTMINIPYLNQKIKVGQQSFYPYIRKMEVMKNGNFILDDGFKENKLLVFSKDGKKLEDISIGGEQHLASFDNDVISIKEDNSGFSFFNTDTKKVDKTIDYKVTTSDMFESMNLVYAFKEDGTLFICDNKGIERLQKDGTLWETVVDGQLNSMSMPSLGIDNLIVSDNSGEEFYVSYYSDNNDIQLMHYTFDKNISSVPQKEINVYSLKENKTIRQSVALYQAKNLDVRVNYVVGMGEEEGNSSDYIRALNTELLAGNGADVLVLDGLPMDSYIEKGVLSDLSDIIKPMEEKNGILTNISKAFYKDNKIYCMPTRFTVPILLGSKEVINVSDSTEHIVKYINDTQKIYGPTMTYAQLICDNLALYSDEFMSDKGVDKTLLTKFLTNLKVIADNTKATEFDESGNSRKASKEPYFDINNLFMCDKYGFLDKDYETALLRHDSLTMFNFTMGMSKNRKGITYDTINNQFVPIGEIGLNAASKNKEIAKDFIKIILSSDVQDTNTFDGLPVIQSSLDKEKESMLKAKGTIGISSRGGKEFSFGTASESEINGFMQKIKELSKPMQVNQIINNMILENALPYFTGKNNVNQAVDIIIQKVNTYLEE
ncbi:ABC transporter substrate-binding protein [Anaeromicropila herbilytica]|uniref:ABC-type glycerol-3-phosphate transport system, substrate-binding protein n=1 Tax=Anaeromicropila herbilytica TaxID=2785025 RepID=A0A7R7EIC6_9FIRM|nr:ABC transporter substrate-binding protein [Anaeromicropila herbilytica]BCN29725.1 hypothetical protein bsdtb5_10200 [Anaeromicropila herbilytica]